MSRWARGKRSKAISERSGFKFKYKEMVREPGTNYFVHWTESDGKWNAVHHPQNKTADLTENIALRWSRPDTAPASIAPYQPELGPSTVSLRPYAVSATS